MGGGGRTGGERVLSDDDTSGPWCDPLPSTSLVASVGWDESWRESAIARARSESSVSIMRDAYNALGRVSDLLSSLWMDASCLGCLFDFQLSAE